MEPSDYTDNAFRGIIKDLRINGELVILNGREMAGNAQVMDCNSPEVQVFAKELVTKKGRTWKVKGKIKRKGKKFSLYAVKEPV